MMWRPLVLAVLGTGGGLVAMQFSASPWLLILACLVGPMAWLLLDSLQAARALRWLRAAESAGAPVLPGLWGEVVERAGKGFKALEREQQRSQARLDAFLEAFQASPNGVVVLNPQDAIEWCNAAAAGHFAIDPERDVAQHIRNLVRDPVFHAYLRAGDFGHPVTFSGRPTAQGVVRRISLQLHPYGKGYKLMLSRDITALELADTMRRDFVANVSHEIRTPLTVLSGFVETLQTLPLSEEEKTRYLGLMQQQAERMQMLVRDLLTLSRLEGSPPPDAQAWLDADEMLQRALSDARGLSHLMVGGRHDLAAVEGPHLLISGAESELASAMSNLLSNAVRYTPAGGRIRAGWRRLAGPTASGGLGGAEFFVTDTGPGIAPEHLPRLTERFYRVDRSRSRETGGTGLGLAIVKHVAQRHGGQIRVESTLGQGSTFTITLPAARVRSV